MPLFIAPPCRTVTVRAAILTVTAVLLGACGPSGAAPTVSASATSVPSASNAPAASAALPAPATVTTAPPQPLVAAGTALAALATLPVKGRAPKTGYTRAQFGQAWADVDRNGCDTRNDILTRDLTGTTYQPGARTCLVLTGTLNDPYSGSPITFTRGETTSSAIQIDHVVALSDAWQTGAQQLDTVRRTTFANDPLNLLAVDGPLNTQKSDSDAASWLPPNKSFRCAYVARQVAVKSAYALWVTPPEHDAIDRVLRSCPGEVLPSGGGSPAATQQTPQPGSPTVPPPAPAPVPAPIRAPGPAGQPFANCAAARAAGAAPVHRGDPGYSPKLDRDGDGIGCE